MKEVSVSLWEVSIDEVLKLLPFTRILIFTPSSCIVDSRYTCVFAKNVQKKFLSAEPSEDIFSSSFFFTFDKPEFIKN